MWHTDLVRLHGLLEEENDQSRFSCHSKPTGPSDTLPSSILILKSERSLSPLPNQLTIPERENNLPRSHQKPSTILTISISLKINPHIWLEFTQNIQAHRNLLNKLPRVILDGIREMASSEFRPDHIHGPIPQQRTVGSVSPDQPDRGGTWATLQCHQQRHRLVAELDIVQEVAEEVEFDKRSRGCVDVVGEGVVHGVHVHLESRRACVDKADGFVAALCPALGTCCFEVFGSAADDVFVDCELYLAGANEDRNYLVVVVAS
jgi:hypothetical protein